MNVLHLIPGAGPGSFGGGPVALNLAREQEAAGCPAQLWSLDSEADRQWAAASSGLATARLRSFATSAPAALRWSREMERAARGQAASLSVVHQHALWTGISRVSLGLREGHGIPSIVTPHGALEAWALKKSSWKKRIALALYERNNLFNASCLHACSQQEAEGFREYGLRNPIAVIPNGVSLDWLESRGDADSFRRSFQIPADRRVMLFLSRITPVKGLPLLVQALQSVRYRLEDWVVLIAGSDESGHLEDIQGQVAALQLRDHVIFTGPLFGQAKRDAFAAAELFVLPTLRENYGIVVAEALGAGVPVLTTRGAPWQGLEERRCGWWVDTDADALAEALHGILSRDPEELRVMGARGREWAAAELTWAGSAQMSIELYQWLLGRREKPEFVLTS
jgi:glycosyltransferase involved in cell wall biosynthesis